MNEYKIKCQLFSKNLERNYVYCVLLVVKSKWQYIFCHRYHPNENVNIWFQLIFNYLKSIHLFSQYSNENNSFQNCLEISERLFLEFLTCMLRIGSNSPSHYTMLFRQVNHHKDCLTLQIPRSVCFHEVFPDWLP